MSVLGEKLAGSVSLKAAVIGALVLIMLIPVAMVEGIIYDRQVIHDYARRDIMQSWGEEQLILGPMVILPFTERHTNQDGEEYTTRREIVLLPEELEYASHVEPEIRHRGLHKVPIYRATVDVSGRFPAPDVERLGITEAELLYDEAIVVLGLNDTQGIAETPRITMAGSTTAFEPGGPTLAASMPRAVSARAIGLQTGAPTAFSIALSLRGSETLSFVPYADTTRVDMSSDWPDPGFFGHYLPDTRQISDEGFSAQWTVSGLGREVPSQYVSRSGIALDPSASAFGVNFYMPVSMYQVTLRATSYAVLIIGLTFVAYFLMEMMTDLRLHPLQYILVGFANALFYLLLISFAEHLGFGPAYLISAAGSTSLIAGYSSAVLGARRRGGIMAAVLTAIYGLLYITLNAETYALLGGAIGLWATLALIMYFTRRIDWYKQGGTPEQAQTG